MDKITQETLFHKLMVKYIPYWPLFVILFILIFAGTFSFLKYALPNYQATASLIIKDEKKGNDDSRLMESLNLIGSKKIIENEIEVLKSRPVIETVIKKMHLYAEVYIKKGLKKEFLYENAPVDIEASDPSLLQTSRNDVDFELTEGGKALRTVKDNKSIAIGEWSNTDYGVLKFQLKQGFRKLNTGEVYSLKFSSLPAKTSQILDNLKVSSTNKLSSVIDVKLIDKNPLLAERVLNEIIVSYNLASIAEKNILAKSTLKFIEERLGAVGAQLTDIERSIQRYKSNSGAVDISTQGQLYLQNVSTNDQKLSEINLQLAVINTLEKDLGEKTNSAGSHTVMLGNADPMLTQMLGSLNTTELEREKLKKTVAENNPILVAVTDQIIKMKDNIRENIIDQRKNLEATKNNLNETNINYNSLLQSIPTKERELLEISRDQNIKSGIYSFLLQKREESELSYVSNLSDSRIINHAQALNIPVSPNPILAYSIALVAILGIPITLVTAKESFATTIMFRQEIEGLTNLPIVGELGMHRKTKPLAIESGKRSLVAEEFRRIRYALQYYTSSGATKKILVTSSISGEGKSFVSSNMAISYSLSGKKVALVDFDLHNSSLDKLFINERKEGILDFLSGRVSVDNIIYPVTGYANLYFLPIGTTQDDPSEMLELPTLSILMDYLDTEFDLVILDSPPVTLVSDAYKLSNYCSATVYVVRHGYTPKVIIKRFDTSNTVNPLVNPVIVFNGVKKRGFGIKNSGYGYGYKYGYGSYYNSEKKA
jgi:capsular exopolysaccharide synthesis family protein